MFASLNQFFSEWRERTHDKHRAELKEMAKARLRFVNKVSGSLASQIPNVSMNTIRSVVMILIRNSEFQIDYKDENVVSMLSDPRYYISSNCDSNVYGDHLGIIMDAVAQRFGITIRECEKYRGDWKPVIKTTGELIQFVEGKLEISKERVEF